MRVTCFIPEIINISLFLLNGWMNDTLIQRVTEWIGTFNNWLNKLLTYKQLFHSWMNTHFEFFNDSIERIIKMTHS